MRQPPRILVGRLFHESHAFSPVVTSAADFVVERGEPMLAAARQSGTTLGGIVRHLEANGATLLAALSASGPPGGLVDHAFYLDFRAELVAAAAAAKPDAIALELHGAMGTTQCPDAEGDLLGDLRRAVGDAVPIVVGLDLHANMTPAMLEAADICIACKENPHSDVVACGEKVASGLLRLLSGNFHPVTTLTKVRMQLPGAIETTAGPLRDLHRQALEQASADRRIWDVSIYNAYRNCDDVDVGQAVVVVSDGPCASAGAIASDLAESFWRRRDEFVDDLLSIDDALGVVASKRGRERFVLADMGDRVLAGAPGDSTAILAAALSRKPLKGAIPVTDAEGVAQAKSLGVGGEGTFNLGGRMTPGFSPLPVHARVVRLGDGGFRMRGPYRGGEMTSLGATAVLQIDGRLSVLLTAKPGFTHDPEAFESNGIDIGEQDFVVVKSGYHFTLNFAGIASPLFLRTPGIGYYTPGLNSWKRARFWPEHDVGDRPIIGPVTFQRRVGRAAENPP